MILDDHVLDLALETMSVAVIVAGKDIVSRPVQQTDGKGLPIDREHFAPVKKIDVIPLPFLESDGSVVILVSVVDSDANPLALVIHLQAQ